MTKEEELEFYNENLFLIRRDIRTYLDHLDDGTLLVYQVSFNNYRKKCQKAL